MKSIRSVTGGGQELPLSGSQQGFGGRGGTEPAEQPAGIAKVIQHGAGGCGNRTSTGGQKKGRDKEHAAGQVGGLAGEVAEERLETRQRSREDHTIPLVLGSLFFAVQRIERSRFT